jgi:hypothetical protein
VETDARYPPHFRRISTASRQEFRSLLHCESADFQRLFHMICTRNGHRKNGEFFIAFFGAFPKPLAGSADEKNGEKKAVSEELRKTRSRGRAVEWRRGFQQRLPSCTTARSPAENFLMRCAAAAAAYARHELEVVGETSPGGQQEPTPEPETSVQMRTYAPPGHAQLRFGLRGKG